MLGDCTPEESSAITRRAHEIMVLLDGTANVDGSIETAALGHVITLGSLYYMGYEISQRNIDLLGNAIAEAMANALDSLDVEFEPSSN